MLSIRIRTLIISTVAGLVLASPAAGSVISRPGAATPLRSGAGWSAWSEADGTGGFRLTLRAPGGEVSRPAIPSSGRPIDLDIGSQTDGSPVVVFNRCPPAGPEEQDNAVGCVPRMLALPPAGADVSVPGVPATATARALTMWNGVFAWAEGDGSAPFVNRLLPTGQLQQVRVQPTILCTRNGRRICRRAAIERITDIDLRGDLLAASFRYYLKGQSGLSTAALWLTNVRTGKRTEVGTVLAGEAGQSFVAPQFVNRRTLGYLLTCPNDPGGCSRRFGEYRLDLRTFRTTFRRDQVPHAGWGSVVGGLVLAPSRDSCSPGVRPRPDIGTCTVRIVSSPRYVRAPAPKLRSRR